MSTIAEYLDIEGLTEYHFNLMKKIEWLETDISYLKTVSGGADGTSSDKLLTKDNWLDIVFPIGYVYMSYEPTSPAQKFGGQWVVMKDVFPYFGSDTSTGGSNEITLTTEQLPSHTHEYNEGSLVPMTSGSDQGARGDTSRYKVIIQQDSKDTSAIGQGQPINNMPAYQTLYAWRRTA